MYEKQIFSVFLLDCGGALLLLLLLLLLVLIVVVFLMMEVLAQFWKSLNVPEARGPEGAPSPIRPPAARRPLSLELPCSSLLSPCSSLALPLLSACYPPLLSLSAPSLLFPCWRRLCNFSITLNCFVIFGSSRK